MGARLDENPVVDKRRPVIKARMRSVRAVAVALVVCAAALAAGCGEKSEPTTPGKPQPFSLREPRRRLAGCLYARTAEKQGRSGRASAKPVAHHCKRLSRIGREGL